jgi:pyridoxamine 5'-phosphate oxidase
LERSVRVEGVAERIDEIESMEYFQSRPRGSKIGAWSSNQSSPISSRKSLEEQQRNVEDKYASCDEIPKPEHWGGYRVVPRIIEFWKGREGRMHDRVVYERILSGSDIGVDEKQAWSKTRLQP